MRGNTVRELGTKIEPKSVRYKKKFVIREFVLRELKRAFFNHFQTFVQNQFVIKRKFVTRESLTNTQLSGCKNVQIATHRPCDTTF